MRRVNFLITNRSINIKTRNAKLPCYLIEGTVLGLLVEGSVLGFKEGSLLGEIDGSLVGTTLGIALGDNVADKEFGEEKKQKKAISDNNITI